MKNEQKLSPEQRKALNTLKREMRNLKGSKSTFDVDSAKRVLQEAKTLGVDVSGYEEQLPELEKKVYIEEIVSKFISFKEDDGWSVLWRFPLPRGVEKALEKALAFGISNDELNTALIASVERKIKDEEQELEALKDKPGHRVEEYWEEPYEEESDEIMYPVREFNKKELEASHSKKLAFWGALLQEIKDNPLYFATYFDNRELDYK